MNHPGWVAPFCFIVDIIGDIKTGRANRQEILYADADAHLDVGEKIRHSFIEKFLAGTIGRQSPFRARQVGGDIAGIDKERTCQVANKTPPQFDGGQVEAQAANGIVEAVTGAQFPQSWGHKSWGHDSHETVMGRVEH